MRSTVARQNWKAGFTLTEVMFAIFILGIGFIMLAAMFPVAIQQTRATVDQTTGQSYACDAANAVQQIAVAVSQYMAPTGPGGGPFTVYTCRDIRAGATGGTYNGDVVWNQLSGSLINPANNTYAFVPLYLRGTNAVGVPNPTAQLFIITCAARATPAYNVVNLTTNLSADVWRTGDTYAAPVVTSSISTCANLATLEPKPASAAFLHAAASPNGVDQVTLSADTVFTSPTFPNAYLAAGSGGYLIVSNSGGTTNGQIFKLGPQLSATTTTLVFQLDPSTPLATDGTQDFSPAAVFLVGRGLADPTQPYSATNPYTGPVQDIGVYTSIIRFE